MNTDHLDAAIRYARYGDNAWERGTTERLVEARTAADLGRLHLDLHRELTYREQTETSAGTARAGTPPLVPGGSVTVADGLRQAATELDAVADATQNEFLADLAGPLADWLEACAGQADAMAGLEDWGVCDEPGSVRAALKVARAITGGAA